VSCARARVVAVKVHTEFFAATLSKRAIMEAWEGGKGGDPKSLPERGVEGIVGGGPATV
jgi:hypothetical protein